MPYVTLGLLKAATSALRGKHPLLVLGIPAMVRAGVDVVPRASAGKPFGSAHELSVLAQFFKVPGAPEAKPYRAIWEDDPKKHWRDSQYPGRSLQRMRTDRMSEGVGFTQEKKQPMDLWGLRPKAGSELKTQLGTVRLVDLAIWYGRTWDVADLEALVDRFKREFPVDRAGLIGTVYDPSIPPAYREMPLAAEPMSREELSEVTGAAAPPPLVSDSLESLVTDLESRIRARGFRLSDGFVRRVLSAWLRGDLVVLVGPGGTGKTMFAEVVQQALQDLIGPVRASWVTVRPDFDESEFIGYERLDGTADLRDVALQILKSDEPLAPHLLILDEFNLALIERYLASILSATQNPERRVPLPGNEQARLPVDTFILATCNSYRDEPESRTRMSAPSKRRSTVITMPNVLADQVENGGEGIIVELALEMIRQEQGRVRARESSSLATSFDRARAASLATVVGAESLSPTTREVLQSLVKALLETPEGKAFFTLGLLRDIALALAYASRTEDDELRALGEQVADKLLHQLQGPHARAAALRDATRRLPNVAEIDRLLARMRGPGDELVPLV